MKHIPETWADLYEHIISSLPPILIPYDELPDDIPNWLANSPLSLHTLADGCSDFFVKYSHWQTVDGDLKVLLFLRAIFAAEMFHSRNERDYPGPDPGTSMTFLQHFITSGWYHEWYGWAQLHFGGEWNYPFDPWAKYKEM